jgi:hypothetical protein
MRSRRADGTTATMMLMEHTRANTARAHGPAKDQEGVHGVGTAGQHARQRAHEDDTRTRNETKHRYSPLRLSRHDIFIMGESVGRFISGPRLFARPELESE